MSNLFFHSRLYLPLGWNSGGRSGNLGIPFNGLPIISQVILNFSSKVPSTGLTFKATGLYFFAKQSSIFSGDFCYKRSSSITKKHHLGPFCCFTSCNSCSRNRLSSFAMPSILLFRYKSFNSSVVSSFCSRGKTLLINGCLFLSRSIIQGTSPLGSVSDSSRFTKNLPVHLIF